MSLVPSYPQPYTLYNPASGHPLYSGPNGEPGFSAAPLEPSQHWTMPDGREAWWHPGDAPVASNQVALGLRRYLPAPSPLTYDALLALALKYGANNAGANVAAAVALAESGGDWSAHNNNAGTGDDSEGLWQVNLLAHPQYRAVNLYNVDQNAAAAADVSAGWSNFEPWSTFLNGDYLQYLRSGPITSGPAPGPGPSEHIEVGPVESVADAIINALPDPNFFGFHPRDYLAGPIRDLAKGIDAALSLIEHGLSDTRQWISDAVSHVETIVDPLINAAEHDVLAVVNFGVGAVEGLAREAGSVAAEALHEAEAIGGAILREAEGFALGLVHDVEAVAEAGIAEAEHLASSAVDGLAHLTSSLIADAEHLAEAGIRDVEGLAAAGIRDAEGLATTLAHDAEVAAEDVLRPLISATDSAWRAFVRDVFAPLESKVAHFIDDVLAPIEPLLAALHQLGDWVLAAARLAVASPEDVAETLHSITPDDVIRLFEAS